MNKLIILGAGGYANVVRDIAVQLGYEIIDMLDDKIEGHELRSFTHYLEPDVSFIPAFGNNAFRLSWIKQLQDAKAEVATLIHPTAYVSPEAEILPGTVVLPHAIVNTDVQIQRGCIINLGAMIDHGCVIEEGCHICLGAIVKADNRISALTKVEAGDVIEARKYLV